MYFKNRAEAGQELASKLKKYKNQQCVVIALNSGGVVVGAQIAMNLHANLLMLISEDIMLPGEPNPIASMTTETFTYNPDLSAGEIDEYVGEYHGFIEGQRIEKFHKLNKLMSDGGSIDPKLLRRHIVILVSDALQRGISLQIAADFLKPINIQRLIIATPLASVKAVDKMHLIGDEICCLNVTENLMEADHYYDDNIVPNHQSSIKIMRNISLNWDFVGRPTLSH